MPPSLSPSAASRWRRPPIQTFPLPYLIFPAILLAIATSITLFIHSDINTALLWSQCHSHARLPGLTQRAPLPSFISTPLCFLASFFELTLDARSALAAFAVVLAFVGGLLTVHTVEAARICNAPSVLIAYPTGPWLVFNLVGGAFVWELVMIPAFLHHGKRVLAGDGQRASSQDQEQGGEVDVTTATEEGRHLPASEVIAIPVAVAIGFYLPTILMLVLKSPAAILVWLFFPVYVSLVRQVLRLIIIRVRSSSDRARSVHLESSRWSLVAVYALPVLFSICAHIVMMWSAALGPGDGDRREETRSVIKFIEIDAAYMGLTVLYWMFVEVGWRVPLVALVSSVAVGSGAGVCLGWIYREWLIHGGIWSVEDNDEAEQDSQSGRADEETPLLT
ncbi:hypothetical protein NLU13_9714 [Sarocladium strictum]|uniref:Corticosteroid-binding protein n=1 Tax=Sarocladium strictum TaxID=5046 RepID=A0AA39GBR2_SARSR|nr:hypothetical protein NLU13_9714 [Sarocladium strictum]